VASAEHTQPSLGQRHPPPTSQLGVRLRQRQRQAVPRRQRRSQLGDLHPLPSPGVT
jgi:hypothetical protein